MVEIVKLRKCARCGRLFPAKAFLRLCDKCRVEYEAERNPKPKICVDCGKEFHASASKRCRDCNQKLRAEKKSLSQIPKLCLWCQAPFFARNLHNKFCSPDCQLAFHDMENRIWSNARDTQLYHSECAKLEIEGKNYQLIERRLFEESEENEEL